MTKHNILRKEYTLNTKEYQLKIPMEIDACIPANDPVRLISQFVEEMDLPKEPQGKAIGKYTYTIKFKGNYTGTKKLTGLKAKTKYYVTVRTYKTVKGVKYYSAWSEVRTVKTK